MTHSEEACRIVEETITQTGLNVRFFKILTENLRTLSQVIRVSLF